MSPEVVAPVAADLVVLEDVEAAGVGVRAGRRLQPVQPGEGVMVSRRDLAAAGDRLTVPAQLVGEDRGLEIVDAGVGPPYGAV